MDDSGKGTQKGETHTALGARICLLDGRAIPW